MSDDFQVIAFRDLKGRSALAIKEAILSWLVKEEIVSPDLTHCVLGREKLGHAPGRLYAKALGETSFDPHELASLVRLHANGLEIEIGRHVYAAEGEPAIECASCGVSRSLMNKDATCDSWRDAIDVWRSGNDCPSVMCSDCGYVSPAIEWEIDWDLNFGELSFIFWNWPGVLSDGFLQQFQQVSGLRPYQTYHHL